MTAPDHGDGRWAQDADSGAQAARAIVLRRLAAAPRSVWEIEQALHGRGIPDSIADEVIDRFIEVGLLDDEAFARAWVISRSGSRGLARARLRRELAAKGVDEALIEGAIAQIDEQAEYERALALAERRLRLLEGQGSGPRQSEHSDDSRAVVEEQRARLVGLQRRLSLYLMRRGYPPSMAAQVSRVVVEAG